MHEEVGRIAASSGIDVLICFGPLSAEMAKEASKKETLKVFHTEKMAELNQLIKENVGPNDAVLFKASHATNLAAAVKANYPIVYFRTVILDSLKRQIDRAAMLK